MPREVIDPDEEFEDNYDEGGLVGGGKRADLASRNEHKSCDISPRDRQDSPYKRQSDLKRPNTLADDETPARRQRIVVRSENGRAFAARRVEIQVPPSALTVPSALVEIFVLEATGRRPLGKTIVRKRGNQCSFRLDLSSSRFEPGPFYVWQIRDRQRGKLLYGPRWFVVMEPRAFDDLKRLMEQSRQSLEPSQSRALGLVAAEAYRHAGAFGEALFLYEQLLDGLPAGHRDRPHFEAAVMELGRALQEVEAKL
jgi:hypothetical protein